MINVKITGDKKVSKGMKRYRSRIVRHLKDGLVDLTNWAYEVSQQRVPVLSGDLKRSGKVVKHEENGYMIRYGDDLPRDYAGIVESKQGGWVPTLKELKAEAKKITDKVKAQKL